MPLNGKRDITYLCGGQDVESLINEMKQIFGRLPIKSKWLTMEQIELKKMKKNKKTN
ncbi:MAG: hypothetical protein IJ583_16420 [Firmicutes bacterium]|nr:hypothetical protein [Bacillota bacterium]